MVRASAMSASWVPISSLVFDTYTEHIVYLRHDMLVLDMAFNKRVKYRRHSDYHLNVFRTFMSFMQWRINKMGTPRWNPKASLCFQRKGIGTILVIGKEILQFDATFKLLLSKEVPTFYQGVQEAMLLTGAVVSDAITDDQESTDSDNDSSLNKQGFDDT